MLRRDVFRSGRWHRVTQSFRLVSGPSVNISGPSGVLIDWTMSAACSGQVEYGLTSSYGSTTTLEPITSGYSSHSQSITGLAPGTTFHFRTKSISAAGTTVYSDDQTFTTSGTDTSTAGPRYGRSTWPDRTTTEWPALPGSYTLVPASVLSASNQATALAAFLNNRTLVPDGTTVVFDRTELGAGTTYTFTEQVLLGNAGIVRANITLWAYNAKFVIASPSWTSANARFFNFRWGGWSNLQWLGGEFDGPNDYAGTRRAMLRGSQYGHAIYFQSSFAGLDIMDVYIHDTTGDGICFGTYTSATADVEFDQQGVPTDLDIAYCRISGTGRQGINFVQGIGLKIRNCIIEDTAMLCIDSEDSSGSTFHKLQDVELTDNVLRRWYWHFATSAEIAALPAEPAGLLQQYWYSAAISINRGTTFNILFSPSTNWTITGNLFEEGSMGWGNPTAEAAFIAAGGTWYTGMAGAGYSVTMRWKPGVRYGNVTFTDNVFDLNADQNVNRADSRGFEVQGNAIAFHNADTLLIDNNTFNARGVYVRGSTAVTIRDVSGIINIDTTYST